MALDTAQQLGAALVSALPIGPAYVYPEGSHGIQEWMIAIHVYPVNVVETAPSAAGAIRRIAPWVQKNRRVARRRACIILPEGFWL